MLTPGRVCDALVYIAVIQTQEGTIHNRAKWRSALVQAFPCDTPGIVVGKVLHENVVLLLLCHAVLQTAAHAAISAVKRTAIKIHVVRQIAATVTYEGRVTRSH